MSSMVPDSAPKPRLCHLKKWPDFNGYGFNLHAEKGKAGQFIGKVDDNSPSSCTGLKDGDRIVEVNGTNIGNENHQQVVQRIKAVPNETKLLVVDQEADEYYKAKKIVIRGDMPNVLITECPDTSSGTATSKVSGAPAAVPDDAPHIRLCHLKLWKDFQGYGFNLHAEKGKPGQYIGVIDAGSPAEAAGLKENDRIIEVNGDNVTTERHGEVVTRIKAVPNETKLLVVDKDTDQYYTSNNIIIRGDLSTVKVITCPDEKGGVVSEPTKAEVTEEESVAPVAVVAAVAADEGPEIRLCHLKIWPDFQGYGFNLHAEKNKTGQFIGKVDANSPADLAGLKEGDRIIEINGESVGDANHSTTVQKIKSIPNETKLLVVDKEADSYYKEKNITLHGSLSNIKVITCPDKSVGGQSETSAPSIRLCHLKIWSDFQGYGFNLHADKKKPGQFIGKIDAGSPALLSGLKEEDRIYAINGTAIGDSNHSETVQKIKAVPNEVKLLVVDKEADKYYSEKGITISEDLPNVQRIECPNSKPAGQVNGSVTEAEVNNEPKVNGTVAPEEKKEEKQPERFEDEESTAVAAFNDIEEAASENSDVPQNISDHESDNDQPGYAVPYESNNAESDHVDESDHDEINHDESDHEIERDDNQNQVKNETTPSLSSAGENSVASSKEEVHEKEPEPEVVPVPVEPAKPPTPEPIRKVEPDPVAAAPKAEPVKTANAGGLEFSGSAKEARERMMSKKKRNDPRQSAMGMKEKYDLFQKL